MIFATKFSTLLPQPSRAKYPKPQYCGDDSDYPAYLARFDAGNMFLEVAGNEFPNLLVIKTEGAADDDFTLENVCANLDIAPDDSFCVIANYAGKVGNELVPPSVRYSDGGLPFYGSASSYELVINLAELCGMGRRAPSWISFVVQRYIGNQRKGVYVPFTITYQEAEEYSQFLHDLFHIAQRHFDPCLIEAILAAELVYFEHALVPETGLHLLNYSMMFSAPVVEFIVNLALDTTSRPANFPHLLVEEIEDNLPFWARCRGVIAHVLHDC